MSTYDETLSITTAILQKHVDANRTIRPNDHIQNDLGLDSLGVMEVIADVENLFLELAHDAAVAEVEAMGEGRRRVEGAVVVVASDAPASTESTNKSSAS